MSVREDLQSIYEQRGYLTPAAVVEEASNRAHPLHSKFEWDDKVAGEAFRLRQAQDLIRSVKIRYVSETTDAMSEPVRAFTSIRTPNGYAYQPTLEVVMDPLRRKMVLADMRRAWQELHRRYRGYEEFWELVASDLPETSSAKAIEAIEAIEEAA